MLHTIKFNKLSAILFDFVDSNDGFLFVRLVDTEPVVNAIWAKLSARNHRGQKWGSPVSIPIAGRSYPEYVAAQKGVVYRTLRTRLKNGLVDLAMIHPRLTVAEDNQQGFYLLTYDPGVPTSFFERLNRCLALPLKPEWAEWLWTAGQQPQTFSLLKQETVRQDGQPVEQSTAVEVTETPIRRLSSLGQVACYSVHCAGPYRAAWLHILRRELGLGIRLKKHAGGYINGQWAILHHRSGWRLKKLEEVMLEAPTLNHLLTEAQESLGLYLITEEDEP